LIILINDIYLHTTSIVVKQIHKIITIDFLFVCFFNEILLSCINVTNVNKRRGNQEWTVQRHWQPWAHKTPDEDK